MSRVGLIASMTCLLSGCELLVHFDRSKIDAGVSQSQVGGAMAAPVAGSMAEVPTSMMPIATKPSAPQPSTPR